MIRSITAALLLSFMPLSAQADGLVDNVNGMTIDGDGRVISFTGLLISPDGRVSRLLQREDKRPEKLDYRLDAEGRTLLPGFIDSHGHVMDLGFSLLTLDLSETTSLEEALNRVKEAIEANPDRKWLIGQGWNQEKWGLGRFPTAADLDAIAPNMPIWLTRVDGHAAWANSAAMRIAKISPTTKSPVGGRIETIAGKPSGLFVDAAMDLVARLVPEPSPKDRDLALIKAQDRLLASGITTIADMGTSIEDWQAYRRAADQGSLRVRIVSYARGIEQMALIGGPSPTPWLYQDRLRLAGVKLVVDGALGSRGAWLKAPYLDAPATTGLQILSGTRLRNQMSRAAMDGFQIAVHAIGDAANADVLDAIAELAPTYTGDRRWRIEHAQIVDPADLIRFASHGTIASMQPIHQPSDWTMAQARMGLPRLAGSYAWAAMLQQGAPLAFGSDTPVERPDVLAGIRAATTREPVVGQADQRLSLAQALSAYTRAGAYAVFAEDRLGALDPGKRADFILVDRDPTLTRPSELTEIRILETWVGGKRVFVADDDSVSGPTR